MAIITDYWDTTSQDEVDTQWLEKALKNYSATLTAHLSDELEAFGQVMIHYLAQATRSFRAVLFVANQEEGELQAVAAYGCRIDALAQQTYSWGEGVVGQAARSRKSIIFEDLPPQQNSIALSTLTLNIHSIFTIPLVFNEIVYGVLELVYVNPLSGRNRALLDAVIPTSATMLESIANNTRTRRLLEETQAQKDRLHIQEQELKENLDALNQIRNALLEQNEQIDTAFKELEKNNDRIVASISYAQRIQQAILPSEERLKDIFNESFIIYRPKDVVSGDFYWFGSPAFSQEETYFVAVVDCTGHGVPGAFMSMIGNTLLNQNIIVKNLDQPSQVLAAIDEDVRQGLKQAESNNRDGMDLLLCKLIPKENGYYELTFSGAKCDLYYVKDGQLGKLRGDRRSMGGAQPNLKVKFTDQVLTLKHGDALYLTTDGWLDNCNLQRKRFGNKRLEDLIIAHHHQPLDIQKTIFTEALEAFQGEQEQRDDITLMAIKL